MKRILLIAMLALMASTQTFSQSSHTITFKRDQIKVVKTKRLYGIAATQQNADFFCHSKGFDRASSFEGDGAGMFGSHAKQILPDGSVHEFESNNLGGEILTQLNCKIEL